MPECSTVGGRPGAGYKVQTIFGLDNMHAMVALCFEDYGAKTNASTYLHARGSGLCVTVAERGT